MEEAKHFSISQTDFYPTATALINEDEIGMQPVTWVKLVQFLVFSDEVSIAQADLHPDGSDAFIGFSVGDGESAGSRFRKRKDPRCT